MHREPVPKKNFVVDVCTINSVISQPTKQQSMSICKVRELLLGMFTGNIVAETKLYFLK